MFNLLKLAIDEILFKINHDEQSSKYSGKFVEEQLLCKNNIIVENCGDESNIPGYFNIKCIHRESETDILILCWVPNSLFAMDVKDENHVEHHPGFAKNVGPVIGTPSGSLDTENESGESRYDSNASACPKEISVIECNSGSIKHDLTGWSTILHGGIFSVNLTEMKSLKLFFDNKELTTGYLVLCNQEDQYKIFHFCHDGMERLAKIFKDWNGCKEETVDTTENELQRIFFIAKNSTSTVKTEKGQELHPDEGAHPPLNFLTWKTFINPMGQLEDINNFRKHVFFSGISADLRKEAWKFLLYYYPIDSTYFGRDKIRKEMTDKYKEIQQQRLALNGDNYEKFWKDIQFTVDKDVVRTDQNHPFFVGPENPNVEKMRSILLNYAIYNPKIGYTQGMSDLLSSLLIVMEDEVDTFWSFVGLMQFSLFATTPRDESMDKSLGYLRELLRVMYPEFYIHCLMQDEDLSLLFCHRWLVLSFKREFTEHEVLRIWESCWSRYQTDYFHIFVSVAIIQLYGKECMDHKMQMDAMMQHFMDLALHFDGLLVLKQARSLLFRFRKLQVIPCTLEELLSGPGVWSGGLKPEIECVSRHRKCCLK